MRGYPVGTRMLLIVSRMTGSGVQELYAVGWFRALITLLDRLTGRPPI